MLDPIHTREKETRKTRIPSVVLVAAQSLPLRRQLSPLHFLSDGLRARTLRTVPSATTCPSAASTRSLALVVRPSCGAFLPLGVLSLLRRLLARICPLGIDVYWVRETCDNPNETGWQ